MTSVDLKHSVDPPSDSGVGSYPTGSARGIFSRQTRWKRRWLAIAGALAVLAATGWFYSDFTGSGETTPAEGPQLLKSIALAAMPGVLGHSVFWAGHQPGARTVFSEDAVGNVQISYLTGSSTGDAVPGSALSITTYPYPGAYQQTLDLARESGIRVVRVNGGIGFIDPATPYFVVLAWPTHPDLQVKVFDPVRNRALKMVRSGRIVPLP